MHTQRLTLSARPDPQCPLAMACGTDAGNGTRQATPVPARARRRPRHRRPLDRRQRHRRRHQITPPRPARNVEFGEDGKVRRQLRLQPLRRDRHLQGRPHRRRRRRLDDRDGLRRRARWTSSGASRRTLADGTAHHGGQGRRAHPHHRRRATASTSPRSRPPRSTAPSGPSRRSVTGKWPSPSRRAPKAAPRPRQGAGHRLRPPRLQRRVREGHRQRRTYHPRHPEDHPHDVRRLTHGHREDPAGPLRRHGRLRAGSPLPHADQRKRRRASTAVAGK